MAKGIGKLLQVGIAKEATRGTAEADGAVDFWVPHLDFDIIDRNEQAEDMATVGVIEDSVGDSVIKEWAEGELTTHIMDKNIALFLLAAVGGLSTSANDPESGVHTHTITVGQNAQHQSITIFVDDPLGGQDRKHALGVVTTFEIAYQVGKILDFKVGLKAKKSVTATLTPSTSTENKFLPQHLQFKLAATQAGLGGASEIAIKSLTLRILPDVEDDDVLGDLSPADFLNRTFKIEGTLEANWQNESDFLTAFAAGTQQAMRIDLINSDVTIGAATNPQLQIDLHKVSFRELTRPVRVGEIVKQTVAFKAHYNTTDSAMVTIKAINTQASY
jgi:hypothetical protein